MPKKRVSFKLNQHAVVPELIGKKPATHKYAKVTRGTLRRKQTDDEKEHLMELAHKNAKRCEMINTAEGCMLLLGKMRHHDLHTFKQWEQTGLAARAEDRRDKGLPPLEEEETDVSDNDAPLAAMQVAP